MRHWEGHGRTAKGTANGACKRLPSQIQQSAADCVYASHRRQTEVLRGRTTPRNTKIGVRVSPWTYLRSPHGLRPIYGLTSRLTGEEEESIQESRRTKHQGRRITSPPTYAKENGEDLRAPGPPPRYGVMWKPPPYRRGTAPPMRPGREIVTSPVPGTRYRSNDYWQTMGGRKLEEKAMPSRQQGNDGERKAIISFYCGTPGCLSWNCPKKQNTPSSYHQSRVVN